MRSDIKAVGLKNINIKGGFWYEKQKLVKDVSIWNVYKRFAETGRFEAFNYSWKEGEPNKPHIFWDSDVAKWIEAVAYICEKERQPEMEKIVDDVVDAIERNRSEDGYFNSYFGHIEPEKRFTRRRDHELYCAGHLLEAAIAYKNATGKAKFLSLMKDYINLIYKVFYVEKSASFATPGHEEIELALIKLYRETGDKKYLDLALYFVDARGTCGEPDRDENNQSHIPVRNQRDAVGHSVRACYLYSAVADLALELKDEQLFETARTLFNSIYRRRMYVTGAIGQTSVEESFMGDYDLPNGSAYAETCANLSLALFARRMSLLDPCGDYADVAELVLYNSFISGMSLDGKSFFYSNMQENNPEVRSRQYSGRHRIFCPADTRVEVFDCSCCPPNVVRTVASVQDFQYSKSTDTVYVHQYMPSVASFDGKRIEMDTEYPYGDTVGMKYNGEPIKLAVRIPGWCKSFGITLNGAPIECEATKGYVYIDIENGDDILLKLDMPVRFIEANPRVWDDAGRIAVARGPIIYCIEGIDNPVNIRDIRLDKNAEFEQMVDSVLSVPVLQTVGYVRDWQTDALYAEAADLKRTQVKLIPYYAFANRGSTDMIIWTMKK